MGVDWITRMGIRLGSEITARVGQPVRSGAGEGLIGQGR